MIFGVKKCYKIIYDFVVRLNWYLDLNFRYTIWCMSQKYPLDGAAVNICVFLK